MQQASQLRVAKIINLLGASLKLTYSKFGTFESTFESLFFMILDTFCQAQLKLKLQFQLKLSFAFAVPLFSILLHNYHCRQAAGGMTAMRMPELVLS